MAVYSNLPNERYSVEGAPGVSYFIPKPKQTVGSAVDPQPENKPIPKLFTPLKIKNLTVANRIGVSPMCTYSAPHEGPKIGQPTRFHEVHYGSFALGGAGLIIVEASSVQPNGRLSPEDLGIWTDEHALRYKEIVDFAHTQGAKIGIQLGHGGRKASGTAMYNHLQKGVGSDYHGWSDVEGAIVGPSPISFSEASYVTPRELTIEELKELVQDFKKAADRAYDIAGFDFVEIHGAHGYLISSFLSGTSNKRTDEYGGSFENRTRLLLEIVDAIKDDKHPLFVRVSATESADHLEGSWKIEDTIKLADLLIEHGVDVLDASAGGNNENATRRKADQGHQVPLAEAIKKHVGDRLLVATVGHLNEGKFANDVLEGNKADIILSARWFLKNPHLPWQFADDLGIQINRPRPYQWPFNPPPFD